MIRPLQEKHFFLITHFFKMLWGMWFWFLFFSHENSKQTQSRMDKFMYFPSECIVLGYMTLFFKKLIAVVVERGVWRACPPVGWKFLLVWRKVLQFKCIKFLKPKKKKKQISMRSMFLTRAVMRNKFFFGVAWRKSKYDGL